MNSISFISIHSKSKNNNRKTPAEIKECTDDLLREWKINNFNVRNVEIWSRPDQGCNAVAVAGNVIGGVAHAFLLIETGSYFPEPTYLLERRERGVQFIVLSESEIEENKIDAKKIYRAEEANINAKEIAEWIEEQQKYEYSLHLILVQILDLIRIYSMMDLDHFVRVLEQGHYAWYN